MLTKRTDGELPAPLEGLAEERITRARAIKLAGAAAAAGVFALFWGTDEADARKRKRRRRRRRRRARVTSPTPVVLAPGVNPEINVTNPSPDQNLTIEEVRLVDSDGSVIGTAPLVGGPVTIGPKDTVTITPDLSGFTVTQLLEADGLRLIDGANTPITVVDENGVVLGDIPLDVSAL